MLFEIIRLKKVPNTNEKYSGNVALIPLPDNGVKHYRYSVVGEIGDYAMRKIEKFPVLRRMRHGDGREWLEYDWDDIRGLLPAVGIAGIKMKEIPHIAVERGQPC